MSELAEAWLKAWQFAARAHGEQKVPGNGLPYVVHVGAVAMEVLVAHHESPFAAPALAVQCALLHDTIEDTAVTEAEVRDAFGPEVAAGVRALSKDPTLVKA